MTLQDTASKTAVFDTILEVLDSIDIGSDYLSNEEVARELADQVWNALSEMRDDNDGLEEEGDEEGNTADG